MFRMLPQPSSPPTAPAATSRAGLGRASAALASGTLVSRALGFVSAAVLAWTIGQTNQGANAFAIANQLPNNIYAIIAGGLLSAVLVPQIVRAAHHDDGGQRFVNRLVTLGIVVFLAVTIVATLCAPLLVALYAQPGRDGRWAADGARARREPWRTGAFRRSSSTPSTASSARCSTPAGSFGPFTWAPAAQQHRRDRRPRGVRRAVRRRIPPIGIRRAGTPRDVALLAGSGHPRRRGPGADPARRSGGGPASVSARTSTGGASASVRRAGRRRGPSGWSSSPSSRASCRAKVADARPEPTTRRSRC